MKRRLLNIGLTLTLIVVALMPQRAFAESNEKSNRHEPFIAEGLAMVVAEGDVVEQEILGKNLVVMKRIGEAIAGSIESCDGYPEFSGTQFMIVEECQTILNMQTGKLTSKATGVVTVTKGGIACMTGSYEASMRGGFTYTAGNPLVFDCIIDVGQIELSGIAGTDFDGVKVKGTVFATLKLMEVAPEVFTLAGPISIRGKRF